MRFSGWLALLLVLLPSGARAQDHAHHAVPPSLPAADIAASRIADVAVRTQADEPRQFYTDLVQRRLVAINFIFTRCTTVCPLMGTRFSQLQKVLGDDAQRVSLISVSIDPLNDTPAQLARWSQQLGAAPGWTLVTGGRAEIDQLLRSLGSAAADPAAHTPIVLIIDDRDGNKAATWRRLDGLSDARTLAQALRQSLARGNAP